MNPGDITATLENVYIEIKECLYIEEDLKRNCVGVVHTAVDPEVVFIVSVDKSENKYWNRYYVITSNSMGWLDERHSHKLLTKDEWDAAR